MLGGEAKKEDTPPTEAGANPAAAAAPKPGGGGAGGKYVPPSMRDGGNKRGESMSMSKRGGRPFSCLECLNLAHKTIVRKFRRGL